MKIEIIESFNEDTCMSWVKITVNWNVELSFKDSEEAEDNNLWRNFSDIFKIQWFINMVILGCWEKELPQITSKEVEREEMFEIQ